MKKYENDKKGINMNLKTKDIAFKSGVSIATVSRYINNSGYVKSETKELIKQAIKDLKCEDNNTSAKSIALILPDLSDLFFVDILKGINEEVMQKGYNLITFDSNQSIKRELQILESLSEFDIGGIIITPVSGDLENSKSYDDKLKSLNVPVVLIDRDLVYSNFDGVFIDDKKGAFDGVEMLINAGHKNIAIITGPLHNKPSIERLEGYKEALRFNNITYKEEYIYEGDFQVESGYKQTNNIIKENKDTSAIFVSNNMMMLGCINAIHENNMKIGKDISLVGFDDLEFLNYVGLDISVVARPTAEMGQIAFDLMEKKIHNSEPYSVQNVVLKPYLIQRGSEKLIKNEK